MSKSIRSLGVIILFSIMATLSYGCMAKLIEVSGAAGSGPYAGAKAKLLTTKNAGMEATLNNSDYEKVYDAIVAVAAESNINILEKEIDRNLKIGEIYGETSTGRESIKVLIQADGGGIGVKVLVITAAEMPLFWIGQPSTTQFLIDKIAKRLNENPVPKKFGEWDQ